MQQQRHTFSQPHTRAHNHHGVVVFELCSQGWTWNHAHCPPNHTTAPPASAVKNTHSLIFTRPTAPLHWKASGRDLYGYGHPSTTSVYFACCCSVRPPCTVCVSVCSVFTCMCALRKCMCVCLQGPPTRVLIGLAAWSWVPDAGQGPSRLAAEGTSSQFHKVDAVRLIKQPHVPPWLVFAR